MDSYESALRDVFLCMHLHHWRINILVSVCLFIKDYDYIHRYPFTAPIKKKHNFKNSYESVLRDVFLCTHLHHWRINILVSLCPFIKDCMIIYNNTPLKRPELQEFLPVSFEGCFPLHTFTSLANKHPCISVSFHKRLYTPIPLYCPYKTWDKNFKNSY